MPLWPRDERYYSRNGWAGVKRTNDGTWILDSPTNNACAHFLHNMFYVLGDRIERCKVGANDPLPFTCPEGCLFYEPRRVSSAGWQVPSDRDRRKDRG